MESTLRNENGTLFIAVSGRLDTVTSMDLQNKLNENGYANVDIDFDFKDVEYIS